MWGARPPNEACCRAGLAGFFVRPPPRVSVQAGRQAGMLGGRPASRVKRDRGVVGWLVGCGGFGGCEALKPRRAESGEAVWVRWQGEERGPMNRVFQCLRRA